MKKELLFTIRKKDFEFKAFTSGGPGGQHQNRVNSGVRIIHRASGAVGESRSDKSQHRNKRLALKRLTETNKFKVWLQRRAFEITGGLTIEQIVEKEMNPKNIKTEIKDEKGRWINEVYEQNGKNRREAPTSFNR